MNLLVSVFGCGLDSFLASLALGFYRLSWRERLRLVAAFGACDGAATLLGSLQPHRLPEPPAFVIYILCALLLARAARWNRRILYALPVLLSIDNLFTGAPANMALLFGLGSVAMAMLGLIVAAASRFLTLAPKGVV